MFEIFIFYILLIFINLIFAFRPTPIVAFPIGLFSVYIGAIVFLPDTTLPVSPYSTIFFILICMSNLFANAFSLKEK